MKCLPTYPKPLNILLFSVAAALATPSAAQNSQQSFDYLSFAQGAVPISIKGNAKELGVGFEHALLAIDGDGGVYSLTPKPGGTEAQVAFVYKLPALTTFTEFAVPSVLETPSPSQTFVRSIEIAGSDSGPEGPFHVLARAALATHSAKGQKTPVPITANIPVRWVRVSLAGGINIQREKTFLDFSEIIGHGSQEPVPLSQAFTGQWKGRGTLLELRQEGTLVSGCYDSEGDLTGNVSGSILRATGQSRSTKVPSVFVLAIGDNGEITGVRSTNGGPFRLYNGGKATGIKTKCSERQVQPPGCGSILHGIQFDFDSATIRRESDSLLNVLAKGLKATTAAMIAVIGHTSSEGADAYNEELSRRRAGAVVAAMTARGIGAGRITAEGLGEKQPIADNTTEAGRSLNRRVEIVCR